MMIRLRDFLRMYVTMHFTPEWVAGPHVKPGTIKNY